jgi:hypothetical protein
MTMDELLGPYEWNLGRGRVKAKAEDEIIVDAWTRICRLLEDRANVTASANERRNMRYAAREIRAALEQRFDLLKLTDEARLRASVRECQIVGREIGERMVLDLDEMNRLIAAGHPLKRRLRAVAIRLSNALGVLLPNIEGLKHVDKTTLETKK